MHDLTLSMTLQPFAQTAGFNPVPAGDRLPVSTLPRLPEIELAENPTLAQIHALEDAMANLPTRVALRNEYFFAPGVCVKSLRMAKGTLATGKMHRTEHLSILAEGTLRITTDEGMTDINAPAVLHSRAGAKRVAYAVTDCTFMTIHATDITDEAALDALLYMPDRPIEGETA